MNLINININCLILTINAIVSFRYSVIGINLSNLIVNGRAVPYQDDRFPNDYLPPRIFSKREYQLELTALVILLAKKEQERNRILEKNSFFKRGYSQKNSLNDNYTSEYNNYLVIENLITYLNTKTGLLKKLTMAISAFKQVRRDFRIFLNEYPLLKHHYYQSDSSKTNHNYEGYATFMNFKTTFVDLESKIRNLEKELEKISNFSTVKIGSNNI